MKRSIALIALNAIFVAPHAVARPAKAEAPVVVVKVSAKLIGGGCDKNCDYDLTVKELVRNETKTEISAGSKMRLTIFSALSVKIPRKDFVATLQQVEGETPDHWRLIPSQECSLRSGALKQVGKGGYTRCVVPSADVGRECTDNSQCASGCIYERAKEAKAWPAPGLDVKGKCKKDDSPYGCYTFVMKGKTGYTICKD